AYSKARGSRGGRRWCGRQLFWFSGLSHRRDYARSCRTAKAKGPPQVRRCSPRIGFGLVSHGCKDHVTHLAEWLFTFVRPTFSVRYAAEGRFARCGGLKPYEGLAKLVRQTLASATFQGRASTGAEIRGALARVYWPGACRHLSRTRETRAPSELFGLRRARRPEVTIAVAD